MDITPENLHTNEDFINSLGLSVEARELLYIIDNRHILPLSEIVGGSIDSSRLERIEVHAELVREIFSKKITILLSKDRRINRPNTELQSAYQSAIRSLLSSSNEGECKRIILLLWNQFDREEAPKKSLGKPFVINLGNK